MQIRRREEQNLKSKHDYLATVPGSKSKDE